MIQFRNNPAQSTRITSPYGYRIHPITKKKTFHYGIDIGQLRTPYEPITAVADGEVIVSHFNKARGYLVIIQHVGFAALYQHLNKMGIPVGTKVKAGDKIGNMGNSGASAGVHLHFEVFDGDYALKKNVDPKPCLLTAAQIKIFETEDEDDMKVYENINELTGDWKDAVQWALDKKIIQGNGKTMGLRESEVKALVFQYRDNKRKGTL
jgi:murein DD-endopeptidase MepM/ murein hydrolase activator NlpD